MSADIRILLLTSEFRAGRNTYLSAPLHTTGMLVVNFIVVVETTELLKQLRMRNIKSKT